ncbi:phage head closure protein [Bisgaard Taxon 46]
MIRAGRYNKVITIQKRNYKKERKRNESGHNEPYWEDIARVRASIEPLQGREYFSGPFQLGENITRVRIRYIPEVTRGMRIQYGDKYLDIYSVIDSKEEHRELQFMCKEGEGHGEY